MSGGSGAVAPRPTADVCDEHLDDACLLRSFIDCGGRRSFAGRVSTLRLQGVPVAPGDALYADEDGIVVLPARAAEPPQPAPA